METSLDSIHMDKIAASLRDPKIKTSFYPLVMVKLASRDGQGWWPATISRPNAKFHHIRYIHHIHVRLILFDLTTLLFVCGMNNKSIDELRKRSRRGEIFVEFLQDGTYEWIKDASHVVVSRLEPSPDDGSL